MDMQQISAPYQIHQTLGTGISSVVRQATDVQSGEQYAIKIIERGNPALDTKYLELIRNEAKILSKLKSPKIVKMKEWSEEGIITKSKGKEVDVMYIVLELMKGGELFNYIRVGGGTSEEIARYYFKQIIDILEYLHKEEICHRDLKAENLLLDENFNLKLVDFGFSEYMTEEDLTSVAGTANYIAPEINLNQGYRGNEVDLFAAGVLLFILRSRGNPFGRAHPKDPLYRLICNERQTYFWKYHSKNKKLGGDYYSTEFKDLLNKMLAFDSHNRLTINEIKSHPWMLGPIPHSTQIFKEFSIIKEQIDKETATHLEDSYLNVEDNYGNSEEKVFVGHKVHQNLDEGILKLSLKKAV